MIHFVFAPNIPTFEKFCHDLIIKLASPMPLVRVQGKTKFILGDDEYRYCFDIQSIYGVHGEVIFLAHWWNLHSPEDRALITAEANHVLRRTQLRYPNQAKGL